MKDLGLPTVDNIPLGIIGNSAIHGKGLFAVQDIPTGCILGVLDGQVVPWDDAYATSFEWNALDKETLLVRPVRTKYGFINHSRQPNTVILYHPIRVVTLTNIAKDEEFTLDYRQEPLPDCYLNQHGSTYL
ncbi:SET domain-containing protein [Grimontia sp. SpTr1]|uniref:SET domain-containing protein-lysine N-methyltransferase n=1 Tax=Grimontia sp. SpTr1 TaxID=2995319 RepID=UPI00248BC3BD|nr:SET domain-containing protein [Grimontia sp. SpTr1]